MLVYGQSRQMRRGGVSTGGAEARGMPSLGLKGLAAHLGCLADVWPLTCHNPHVYCSRS